MSDPFEDIFRGTLKDDDALYLHLTVHVSRLVSMPGHPVEKEYVVRTETVPEQKGIYHSFGYGKMFAFEKQPLFEHFSDKGVLRTTHPLGRDLMPRDGTQLVAEI